MKMAMCTQQLKCLIWIDCFVLTLESLFNCVHSFLCAILQKQKTKNYKYAVCIQRMLIRLILICFERCHCVNFEFTGYM